jgi:hypothetical protein
VNEGGQVVSPQVESRYIVEGLKPKIESVSFNNLDQRLIERFEARIAYSDIPFNSRRDVNGEYIDSRTAQIFGPATDVSSEATGETGGVLVLDELYAQMIITDAVTGAVLAQSDKNKFVDSFMLLDVAPISESEQIEVEVLLEHEGVTVDVYSVVLDIAPGQKEKGWWDALLSENISLLIGGIAVVFLILVLMLIGVFSHRKKAQSAADTI